MLEHRSCFLLIFSSHIDMLPGYTLLYCVHVFLHSVCFPSYLKLCLHKAKCFSPLCTMCTMQKSILLKISFMSQLQVGWHTQIKLTLVTCLVKD